MGFSGLTILTRWDWAFLIKLEVACKFRKVIGVPGPATFAQSLRVDYFLP